MLVRGQRLKAAQTLNGNVVIDDGLLEEVTALTEWPCAVVVLKNASWKSPQKL